MPNPSLKAKLDAIFNAHMNAELAGDLDQTLATMAPNPIPPTYSIFLNFWTSHGRITYMAL